MRPMVDESSAYRYAVFRYVTDTQRDMSLPVGVALWRADSKDVHLRFVHDDETVRGAGSTEARQFITRTCRRVRRWVETGELPYADDAVRPYSDGWWDRLRGLYGGRAVTVKRLFRSPDKWVIAEAVNLASPQNAEDDADALTSRAMRVSEGARAAHVRAEFLIGYVASPGGLNGEYALKKWIEDKLETSLFDLNGEAKRLEQAALAAVAAHKDQLPLLPAQSPD